MADEQTIDLRRKHSSIDLQQVVVYLDLYKRPLNGKGGKSGALFGFAHQAAVATTELNQLYLIEKGVSKDYDIDYPVRYRENECRIVEISTRDIRDWKHIRKVNKVEPGVTLEDLFYCCGSEYSLLTDNCWNGVHRMRAGANPDEDGLAWQGKAAIGVGVVAVAGIGIGLLAKALSDSSKEKRKKKSQH